MNGPTKERGCRRPWERLGCLALVIGALTVFGAPTAVRSAAAEAQLPRGSAVDGVLRRGPDGKLERVTPGARPGGELPCDAGTLCVGPGHRYATIAAAVQAARDEDTIGVAPGTYRETFVIRRHGLTLRGLGQRPRIDCAGMRPASDKACIVLAGDNITLENLDISGAEIPEDRGANAACVRNERNRSFVLRRIVCHGSQNGLLTDGGSVLIEESEFYDNSWTGLTHNVYLSGDCPGAVVRKSTFRDARVAHEFKSRCRRNEISHSTFYNLKGSRALDLPDGGDTVVLGGTIVKAAGTQNHDIVAFAPESCKHPGSLRMMRVRFVVNDPLARIANYDKCPQRPVMLDNVTFEGFRPELKGDVQVR